MWKKRISSSPVNHNSHKHWDYIFDGCLWGIDSTICADGNIVLHKAVMVGRYDYLMAVAKGFTLGDRQKLNETFTFFWRIPKLDSVARSELLWMGSWDRHGNTPLYLLVAFGQNVGLMRNLALAHTSGDVNIEVQDTTNGRTLLLFACQVAQVEIMLDTWCPWCRDKHTA